MITTRNRASRRSIPALSLGALSLGYEGQPLKEGLGLINMKISII